jgi:hypothetical protein
MKIKKCMWCLKEFEANDNKEKYCSDDCQTKSNNLSKSNKKEEASSGFFTTIVDAITSIFS